MDVRSDASSYCLIGRLADKTVVGSAPIYILIFPALLLIAGDTAWPEGWIFCIWSLVLCYLTILYLYRRDPALFEERYKQPGCRQPGTLEPVRGLQVPGWIHPLDTDTGRSCADCALRGRIVRGEAMLTWELPGYREYIQNVRYRLVPHLW